MHIVFGRRVSSSAWQSHVHGNRLTTWALCVKQAQRTNKPGAYKPLRLGGLWGWGRGCKGCVSPPPPRLLPGSPKTSSLRWVFLSTPLCADVAV